MRHKSLLEQMTPYTARTVGKNMLLVQVSPSVSLWRKKKKKTKHDISRVHTPYHHTPTRAHFFFWTYCSWALHDSGKSQKVWMFLFAPTNHQESLLHLNWRVIKTRFSLPSHQIIKGAGSFDPDSNIAPIVSLKTLGGKMPTRHFTVIEATFGEYWWDLMVKWCRSPVGPFVSD